MSKIKIVGTMIKTPAQKIAEADNDVLWPGGEAATKRCNCTCPYSENYPENVREVNGQRIFSITENCPVHGRTVWGK